MVLYFEEALLIILVLAVLAFLWGQHQGEAHNHQGGNPGNNAIRYPNAL